MGKQCGVVPVQLQFLLDGRQGSVHLPGIGDRRKSLITEPGSASIPGVRGAPGQVEQRHGASCTRQMVYPEAMGMSRIGEGMFRTMAGSTRLSVVSRQPFLVKEFFAKSDAFQGERVVG